jgi:pimeloyl-ACP methyl ester carboxylesterase
MLRIPSSESVDVAVHELGGARDAPPLLISHATGFHAHCYEPVAARLATHFRVYGLDYRGHGQTAAPEGWQVDWQRFGDDAQAVGRAIAPAGGLIGVGHSMGGAALVMAAHREPDLFDHLVLFEPIAIPDDSPRVAMDDHQLVVGARRRRRVFDSFDDAIANFGDKLPLALMTPAVLRAYVEHGFRPITGDDGRPAGVELCCPPEIEAGIFTTSADNGVWEILPEVTTPTTVVTGHIDEQQPSGRCEAIAERIPGARYVLIPHQSHLGPFSHPEEFADLVLAEVGSRTL